MKLSVKIWCLSIVALFFLNCGTNDLTFEHEGIIIGRDLRKCACQMPACGCCGAYIVEINNEPYYFFELPKGSDINLDVYGIMPLAVRFNFIYDPESCGPASKYILITEIKRK